MIANSSRDWIRGCYGSTDLAIVEPGESYEVVSARSPVDPAGTVENAKPAFPTVPWTAPTPRRPQAPQGAAAGVHQKGLEQIGAAKRY